MKASDFLDSNNDAGTSQALSVAPSLTTTKKRSAANFLDGVEDVEPPKPAEAERPIPQMREYHPTFGQRISDTLHSLRTSGPVEAIMGQTEDELAANPPLESAPPTTKSGVMGIFESTKPLLDVPENPKTAMEGLHAWAANVVNSVASPGGIATLPMGGPATPMLVKKALGIVFGAQGAHMTYESALDLVKNAKENTPAQNVMNVGNILMGGLMAAGGAHAIKGAKPKQADVATPAEIAPEPIINPDTGKPVELDKTFEPVKTQPENTDASEIPISKSIPEPEIRTPVGQTPPLRQQREIAKASEEIPPVVAPVEKVTPEPTGKESLQVQPEPEIIPTRVQSVAKMPLDEFFKFARNTEGGLTGEAYRVGQAIKTPEELTALKSAQEKSAQDSQAYQKAGDFDKGMIEANRGQFFREAYEAATGTGSAGLALAKDPSYKPPFPVEVQKVDEPAIPSTQEVPAIQKSQIQNEPQTKTTLPETTSAPLAKIDGSEQGRFISDLKTITPSLKAKTNPIGTVTLQFPIEAEKNIGSLLREYGVKIRNNGFSKDFKLAEWEIEPGGTARKLLPLEQRLDAAIKGVAEGEKFASELESGSREARLRSEEERLRKLASGEPSTRTSKIIGLEDSLTDAEKQRLLVAAAKPISESTGLREISKVRVGSSPQLHTIVRELPRAQGDLPAERYFEVKNDNTGAVQTVESADLTPVKERTGEKVKAPSLDDRLRAVKLDPSVFPDAKSKKSALERAEAKLAELQGKLRGKTFTGITGLEPAILDGALTIARATLRATNSVVKAVQAALEWVRTNHADAKFDENEFNSKLASELEQQEAPKVTTQVMGSEKEIAGRPTLTPDSRQASVDYAGQAFKDAGIDAEPVTILDKRRGDMPVKLWKFNTDFNLNAEGRKLISILEKDLETANDRPVDLNANLIRSIQWNIENGNLAKMVNGQRVMDIDIARRLDQLATSETSRRGAALGALAGHSVELENIAHDPQLFLLQEKYKRFGGEQYESFVTKVVTELGKELDENKLNEIADAHPKQRELITQILNDARKDEGGRVYRTVQSLLKPKNAKKVSAMENDARIQEAVSDILEQAKNKGIEPVKPPGKRSLTPVEQLLHLVEEKNSNRVNELIIESVREAERNAGIKAALAELPEAERAGAEARFNAGEFPTPEQVEKGLQLPEYAHWKVLRDNLLGYSPVSEKLATKVVPTVTHLAKEILDTPKFNQPEIREQFIQKLADENMMSPEQAQRVAAALDEIYKKNFEEARKKALDDAVKSMSPAQKKVIAPLKKNTSFWSKLEKLNNAGGLDTDAMLSVVAENNGWKTLTPEIIAKFKGWSDEIQKLRELTPKQKEAVGDNPVDIQRALVDREAETLERRLALKKQIETMFSRLTLPLNLKNAQNYSQAASAAGEFASAALLLKLGFPTRQMVDVTTQALIHNPTRAIAEAWKRIEQNIADGKPAEAWGEFHNALSASLKTQMDAVKSSLVAAKANLTGVSQARNIDNLISRIALFERATQAAAEYSKKGENVKAALLTLFTQVRWGRQIAAAFDNLSGVPVEMQERRQLVETWLRENGMTRAEAKVKADDLIGDINTEWQLGIARAKQLADQSDYQPTKTELELNGLNIAKARAMQRIKDAGLPADAFAEKINDLRELTGWNIQEDGGVGGLVAAPMRKLVELGEGFPPAAVFSVPFGRFSNAIAISANRAASFTPLGFFPDAFGVHTEGAKKNVKNGDASSGSAWYRTAADRRQRKVEALIGTTLGGAAIALVASGLAKVQWKAPQDKEERELWLKQGHKAGTVEFMQPDGSFIPVSLTVGPLRPLAPYLVGAGAVATIEEQRAKQQAKLDADADRQGLPRTKIAPIGLADLLSVAAQTAWSTLIGGRTAQGLVGSVTDYGIPNPSKAAAAALSPILPPLPAYQEIARMMGVQLDPKMAGFFDFLVPLPTSPAAAKNMLGDPVGNDNDIQRIVQTLSGGSYPALVNPNDIKSQAAYGQLLETGYRPPSISPNKSYEVNGVVRTLNNSELSKYTELRGQYLKTALAALPAGATKEQASAAYRQANAQALSELGIDTVPAAPRASPASVTAPRRSRLSLGRRTTSTPRISIKKLRRARVSRPRRLRLRSSRARTSRLRLRRNTN